MSERQMLNCYGEFGGCSCQAKSISDIIDRILG
jgi:hypothetical protein